MNRLSKWLFAASLVMSVAAVALPPPGHALVVTRLDLGAAGLSANLVVDAANGGSLRARGTGGTVGLSVEGILLEGGGSGNSWGSVTPQRVRLEHKGARAVIGNDSVTVATRRPGESSVVVSSDELVAYTSGGRVTLGVGHFFSSANHGKVSVFGLPGTLTFGREQRGPRWYLAPDSGFASQARQPECGLIPLAVWPLPIRGCAAGGTKNLWPVAGTTP